MSKNQQEAVEITTFKLRGYTCQQFIEANKEVDTFLKRQPGFKSRRIFEQGGVIVDMLIWENEENGTASMHRLMKELGDSVVHGMIDKRTVSWNISDVQHFI